jgi:hypothetical protein
MTFYEFGIKELTSRGMFNYQAVKVIKNVMSGNDLMQSRWNEDISGYPLLIRNFLWMDIEKEALNFIKISCPEAWFRPVFDKDHPLRKEFEAMQGGASKWLMNFTPSSNKS